MRAVIGLANPGSDYEGTRHNVGAEVVGELVRRAGETLARGPSRVPAVVTQIHTEGQPFLLAVPTTFMNESGRAVRAVLDYFKLGPQDLLVIHDDIDLAFGRLRIQQGGGTGGHNGLRSIESALGSREFTRLKVGVGRPPGSQDPADYVLRRFTKQERPEVDLLVVDSADTVDLWFGDVERAKEAAALRGRDG